MTTITCECKTCVYNEGGTCSRKSINMEEGECSEGYDFVECMSWEGRNDLKKDYFSKEEMEKLQELKNEMV